MKNKIVFDFDGVLVDSNDLKGATFATVLDISSPDKINEIADHHRANPSMGRREKISIYMSRYVENWKAAVDIEQVVGRFSKTVTESLVSQGLIEGAFEFLQTFNVSHDLQICSSAPAAEIESILSQLGLRDLFSEVCGYPTEKKEFLRSCSVVSANVIFVGDSQTDLISAENAGVDFIGFRLTPPQVGVPNVFNFRDLPQAIQKIEMRAN